MVAIGGGGSMTRVVCGFQWWWLVGFGRWVLILILRLMGLRLGFDFDYDFSG